MFDVEYGDLSASAIASRLGPEPKRRFSRETRFKDKRMRKKAKQDEMKETPDTIWVFVKFYSLWSFWLRNSLICLGESRVSAGARWRERREVEGAGGSKPFFSCRMRLVTNALGDGHKLSVLLTLHEKNSRAVSFFINLIHSVPPCGSHTLPKGIFCSLLCIGFFFRPDLTEKI